MNQAMYHSYMLLLYLMVVIPISVYANNDPDVLIHPDALNVVVDEGDTASVKIRVSQPQSYDIKVLYKTLGGADGYDNAYGGIDSGDFLYSQGEITIPKNKWTALIPIQTFINNDPNGVETEAFRVILEGVVQGNANLGANNVSIVRINEALQDQATVSVEPKVSVIEGDTAKINVSISTPQNDDVVISYKTLGGSGEPASTVDDAWGGAGDFVYANKTVTIKAGDSSVLIPIKTNSDDNIENQEVFRVELLSADNPAIEITDEKIVQVFIDEPLRSLWLQIQEKELYNSTGAQGYYKLDTIIDWMLTENCEWYKLNRNSSFAGDCSADPSQRPMDMRNEPWSGVKLGVTWGKLQTGPSTYDFSVINEVLDRLDNSGLKAALLVSDKYWIFGEEKDTDNEASKDVLSQFKNGPIPSHLIHQDISEAMSLNDVKDIDDTSISCVNEPKSEAANAEIVTWCHTEYFFARMQRKSEKTAFIGKFFAKSWNPEIQSLWNDFHVELASTISNHPALTMIETPESSIAIDYPVIDPNENRYPYQTLIDIGYSKKMGANDISYEDRYAIELVERAKNLRALYPANIYVTNNINWIPRYLASGPISPSDQQVVAAESSVLNISWWVQDIVTSGYFPAYERLVYPEFSQFEGHRRWANITGETLISIEQAIKKSLATINASDSNERNSYTNCNGNEECQKKVQAVTALDVEVQT